MYYEFEHPENRVFEVYELMVKGRNVVKKEKEAQVFTKLRIGFPAY